MSLFGKLFGDSFGEWLKSASDADLKTEREKARLEYCSAGDDWAKSNNMRRKMDRIDDEVGRRYEENHKNDPPPSKESHYRWTDKNRWEKD